MYYADDGISFLDLGFENDVNMYGTQAQCFRTVIVLWFENDVNMYGTQAIYCWRIRKKCLRMM